jgi:hypothetical protein
MNSSFEDIDRLLNRANKLYFSYTLSSFTFFSTIFYVKRYSKLKSSFFSIFLALPVSACLTWVHVLKTFSEPELTFLLAGLDPSYPEIKASRQNPKNK